MGSTTSRDNNLTNKRRHNYNEKTASEFAMSYVFHYGSSDIYLTNDKKCVPRLSPEEIKLKQPNYSVKLSDEQLFEESIMLMMTLLENMSQIIKKNMKKKSD